MIEGLPEDDGQVRLAIFVSQLNALSATMGKLDRELHGTPSTYLTIAELSYQSPVRVVLEPHRVGIAPPDTRRRFR